MKTKTLKSLFSLAALATLLPTAALAQLTQTLSFTIDNATGNGVNLLFNKINVSPLEPLYITLTLNSITTGTGTLLGTNGSPGSPVIPTVTFTDVLSLSNATPAPANITTTDNYIGSPIFQNESLNIVIPATGPNSFTIIPQSTMSTVIQNLVNFEGTSGTFDLNVNSNLTMSNQVNANIQNFHPVINGTLTVSVVPEPSTWILSLVGLGLVAGWRLRQTRA